MNVIETKANAATVILLDSANIVVVVADSF
jgi:hypothetical protein